MQKAFTIQEINSITKTLIGVSHASMKSGDDSFLTVAEYMKGKMSEYANWEDIPWENLECDPSVEWKSPSTTYQRKQIFPELWAFVESFTEWDLGCWKSFPVTTSTNLSTQHTFAELLRFFGLNTFDNPLGGFVGDYNARIPDSKPPKWFDPRCVHRFDQLKRGTASSYPKWQIVKTDRPTKESGLPMLFEDHGFIRSKECDELLGKGFPNSEYELHVKLFSEPVWVPQDDMHRQFNVYRNSTTSTYCDIAGRAVATQSDTAGDEFGWMNQTRLMRRKKE